MLLRWLRPKAVATTPAVEIVMEKHRKQSRETIDQATETLKRLERVENNVRVSTDRGISELIDFMNGKVK